MNPINPESTKSERYTLGFAWNEPADVPLDREGPAAVPFDQPPADFVERPIYELFEIIAARHAAAFALGDDVGKLTFAEVRNAVRLLAGVIATRIPTGRAVAVLLPNVPASVIGVLACLAAGRCCLVLNADHPAERNAAILRDADVHAVIVKDDVCSEIALVPAGVARIVMTGANGAEGGTAASWRCPTTIGPDEPAVVLYTSGSTGQPKGIVLSQATILARVRNNILSMHLNSDDRFLSLGALGTTAGLVASIVALLGGSMQFVMSAAASGASSLLSLIRNERVTILWGVPALLRLLFEADGARDALTSLRLVRTFGDRLLKADLERWRAALPISSHFAITYGQTEVTATQWFVPAGFTSNDAALPTGYLLSEHQFVVVDEDGRLAGEGEIGELILRSRYLALGTWEHGRCVAGRTRPDPSEPLLRILPTGDLVRLRHDGLLQVIGRCDRQVKIRGQRVEPAEIEDALRRVAGVADAAIVARRSGEEISLLAFTVASDPNDTTLLDRVRKGIRMSLPNYMQPARMLLADRLPLLPGGKVDDEALLQIAKADAVPVSVVEPAPASATADAERAVATAWRRVLGLMPAPGVTFLDAGGDSLQLLELVFALEIHTRRQLPLDAFVAEASAAQMALALDTALRNPTPPPANRGVFLLAGARGDTPGLAGLRADCLPVVAMQMLTYPDWREMLRAGLTLEGIAENAVAQIRAMSPEGPVCMVGYSFGADVAFAASCILESQGREVARLVLIDMPPPPQRHSERHVWSPTATARKVWRAADRLRRAPRELLWTVDRLRRAARVGMAAERFGMIAAPFATSVMRRLRFLTFATSRATKGWSQPFGELGYWTEHHMGQELRLQAAHEWALHWRAPAKRLRAPLLLVRSAAHRQDAPEDLGWSELAEQVQVAHVQGTHVNMLSAAYRKGVSDAVGAALASALSAPHRSTQRMPI